MKLSIRANKLAAVSNTTLSPRKKGDLHLQFRVILIAPKQRCVPLDMDVRHLG